MDSDPVELEKQRFRSLSGEEKLVIVDRLMHDARALKTAYFRMRHPEWDDKQVQKAVAEVFVHART